jgi:hypothetical protein
VLAAQTTKSISEQWTDAKYKDVKDYNKTMSDEIA